MDEEDLIEDIKHVLDSEILSPEQKYDIMRDLIDDYDDAESDGVPVTIGT